MADGNTNSIIKKIRALASEIISNSQVLDQLDDLLVTMTKMSKRTWSPNDKFWIGSLPLDYLIGQVSKGIRIHIFGPPSSGKTSLFLDIIKKLPEEASILYVDTIRNVSQDVLVKCEIEPDQSNLSIAWLNQLALLQPCISSYDFVIVDDIKGVIDIKNLPDFLGECKRSLTTVLCGDQIRSNIAGGSYPGVYRFLPLFDVTLRIQRSKKLTGYIYSDMSITRYRQKSYLNSRRVQIPIRSSGIIDTSTIIANMSDLADLQGIHDNDISNKIYNMIEKETQ